MSPRYILILLISLVAIVSSCYGSDGSNSTLLVAELSDENVDSAVSSNPFFVLDCYVTWCEPCLDLSDTIQDLAADLRGQVAFGKIDVEENELIAQRYNISEYPTILIFENGMLVNRQLGSWPEQELLDLLRSVFPSLSAGDFNSTGRSGDMESL